VISHLTKDFRACFKRLPASIKKQSRKAYELWQNDPQHPSLDFKRVGKKSAVYSVRVAIGWRALGLKQYDEILWFWIGSHANYDRLLKQF
jgi:hypothetical protein